MTYHVYQLYDAAGQLLYVGCSKNPEVRMLAHRRRSWWGDVAQQDVDSYPTEVDALDAERQLIESQAPKYNRTHHPNPGLRLEAEVQVRYPIPDSLHHALKVRAAQEGVTMRELVTRLLSQALDEKEDK